MTEQLVPKFSLSDLALAAESFDIDLSGEQLDRLAALSEELADWNQRVNLTSITDPNAVSIFHLLDSLTVIPALM